MRIKFKYILFLSAGLYSGAVTSVESIYLKLGDQPERSVKLISNINTELVLNIIGDEELIKQNRQRGINFPYKISNYKTQKISTATGKLNEDGTFTFEKRFEDNASFSEDEFGNRIHFPDSADELVGVVIKGEVDDKGKLKKIEFEGKNIGVEKENIFRAMFEQVKPESYQKAALKVGDSFSKKMPIDMPVPGHAPIRLNSTTIYNLRKIDGDKAIFSIDMVFSLGGSPAGIDVNASGEGGGSMIYNTKDELQELLEIKMTAEVVFQTGAVMVSSKMISKSVIEQFLSDGK